MKKLFLFVVLAASIGLLANAQVTKSDVSKMLTEVGSSIDKIETLMVYNTISFYTDGSYGRSYKEYPSVNGDYTNSFALLDNGIVMNTKKNGTDVNRYFYPYTSIAYIEVGAKTLWVYLKD